MRKQDSYSRRCFLCMSSMIPLNALYGPGSNLCLESHRCLESQTCTIDAYNYVLDIIYHVTLKILNVVVSAYEPFQ